MGRSRSRSPRWGRRRDDSPRRRIERGGNQRGNRDNGGRSQGVTNVPPPARFQLADGTTLAAHVPLGRTGDSAPHENRPVQSGVVVPINIPGPINNNSYNHRKNGILEVNGITPREDGTRGSVAARDPAAIYSTLCSENSEALPPGWERIIYMGREVYLDHLSREAYEEPPWRVWARRSETSGLAR
eukprot:Tbor_TRINITY_DN4987_c6_g1::TRINITY_DN4987_c6_g1_i1::g.9810::m.9810